MRKAKNRSIYGHALFNIHCITPVELYLFLVYASNIALIASYEAI